MARASTSWKPGQSGNPKGKPPGTLSLVSLLKRKLAEVPEGQKLNFAELFIQKYVKEALGGKGEMLKDAFDRIDGKAKSSDGELGTQENPIHTVHKVVWE